MESRTVWLFEKLIFFSMGFLCFSLSFTSLRKFFGGPVLEVLFFLSLIVILGFLIHFRKSRLDSSIFPIFFMIFAVAPLTFLNYFQDFPGSSLETLFALILAAGTGYIIAQSPPKLMINCAIGIGSAGFLIILLLLISDFSFTGFARFSALSNNPNQLALYVLSSFVIIFMLINNELLKTVFFTSLLICGLSTFSDAFVLSLVIAIIGYLFSKSISSTTFLILGLPALLIVLFLLFLYVYIFFNLNLLDSLIDFWNEADQGGTRLSLYQNGIIAFLYSPLLGHGAGAFAGISIPFEKFEAHNTFIDLATIGGLLLPLIFYAPLVIAYFVLMKKKPLASAMLLGLIFFTLFHFVARHPIIWLVWGICFNQLILNFLSTKSPSPS